MNFKYPVFYTNILTEKLDELFSNANLKPTVPVSKSLLINVI